MTIIEAAALLTILIGFIGIIFKRNLFMKIIAMDIMATGVIFYYVFIAARTGLTTPIQTNSNNVSFADPVPQAVILTAIVIGFSIQALLLVSAMKLSDDNPTMECKEIEEANTQ